MTKDELKIKLDELKIDERAYSLDGEHNADSIVLVSMSTRYKVLYISERGDQSILGEYENIDGACEKILELILDDIKNSGSTVKRT